MSLSSPILVNDNEAVRWCKLQRAFRAIADNAGISYTMSGLLTDIAINDNIGVRWAKLGAWAQLIANNISGGGGGAAAEGGLEALAQTDTSIAIVFPTAFAAKPAIAPVLISPTGATSIAARVDYSTLTTTGVTIRFTAIPASGWFLSWIATEET